MADFNFGGTPSTPTGKGAKAGIKAAEDQGALVFDLTGVEEPKGFEVLPKGKYNAIVDEIEFKESAAGNPMIVMKYAISEGEYSGRILFDYWTLTKDSLGLGKLKVFLMRICPEIPLNGFDPTEFAANTDLIGRELVLDLIVKVQTKGDYKGEKQNKIKDIGAIGETADSVF